MKREMPSPEEILAASERTGIDPVEIAELKPYEACLICAWRPGQTISELSEAIGMRRNSIFTQRSILRERFPGILPTVTKNQDTEFSREKKARAVERIASLREQIAKGSSPKEALEILGISLREWRTLSAYARRHWIEIPALDLRKRDSTAKFLALITEGKSTAEAAELLGMPLPVAEGLASRLRKRGVIDAKQGRGQEREILARWAKEEGITVRQLKLRILREAAQAWKDGKS